MQALTYMDSLQMEDIPPIFPQNSRLRFELGAHVSGGLGMVSSYSGGNRELAPWQVFVNLYSKIITLELYYANAPVSTLSSPSRRSSSD